MPSCREIDALVTPYVDGVATGQERAVVDAHLLACPPCRRRAEAEAAVRETLRCGGAHPCAPAHLRKRCSKVATPMGRLTATHSPAQLSMFAAAVMILGGVSMYGATRMSATVLAAQLTLDHVKCFALHRDVTPLAPAASEAAFQQEYGWRLHVPTAPAADALELVGVRRCFCAEGPAVHVMYRYQGEPLSLYVLPNVSRPEASADIFGHDAVIWTVQNTTYVLLGREPGDTLHHLAMDLN